MLMVFGMAGCLATVFDHLDLGYLRMSTSHHDAVECITALNTNLNLEKIRTTFLKKQLVLHIDYSVPLQQICVSCQQTAIQGLVAMS